MTSMPDLLPEGLRDSLPDEAARATAVMRAALSAMDSHGYERVRPPLVEFESSLAARMAGVSARGMFRFVDPASLRMLALRSDMTVQVGRIAATALADMPRPLRLCYAGDTAQIAASQLDPARARLQMGAELVGHDSVEAAGEIVALAVEAARAAGATGLSVDFTLPDIVEVLAAGPFPLDAAAQDAVRRELDTKDAGGLREAGGADYLPLLYAAGPFDEAVEKLRAIDAGGALASRITGLEKVAARLPDDVRLTLDPSERHGFEYQSWLGFTLYAEGVRGPVGRGGTYSIGEGETAEPATGFSIYADRLVEALATLARRNTLFLPLGHDPDIAAGLRAEGWRTVAAISPEDEAEELGCTHRLAGGEPHAL